MQATSHAQYDSTVKGSIPDLERVGDGVWALPVAVPHGSVPYSLCYLVRDAAGAIHVIDPGFHNVDNWGALAFALSRIGSSLSKVASIVVTHLHPDHMGMADRLHRSTRAPVLMHRIEVEDLASLARGGGPDFSRSWEEWGVPPERRPELLAATEHHYREDSLSTPAVPVDDGDRLDIPGRDIRVIHTPGHTPGHLALRFVDERLLVTGDHVLPNAYPDLSLRGDDRTQILARYLLSLEQLAEFDDYEVLPGHGYRFIGLAGRCDRIAKHHLRRAETVRHALAARPGQSLWQIASTLSWNGGWENLHGFYLLSALRETAMHLDYLALRPAQ
jgi:glyoxylase-like metal-dependent hydrolase (beta-lactamase superfamily II)